MFNLGFSELIILGAIALIFIGPQQLPEVARTVGRMLNEWKRATSDLTSSITDNDAFRDWEDRRNKYLSENREENAVGAEKPEIAEQPEPEGENTQMELNLDVATTETAETEKAKS